MAAITMISSAFALLLLISQVAFAQQWTPGGRRKHVGELLPTQSCYVTEYNMQLTCTCENMESAASLDLKMSYYVFQRSPNIRMVYIQHCSELYVRLDFRGVDSTNFPVYFRSLQKLHIEEILFEPTYDNRQELQLNFYNVQEILMKNLMVQDTFKMHAENVKETRITNSTFTHIPTKGMIISQAKLLDIQDSRFFRVYRQSIIVEKTKKVSVVNNEMTTDALKVVYAKDGSHLLISCNRLLGKPPTPECTWTTSTSTTTTTTTTTTSTTTTTTQKESSTVAYVVNNDDQDSFLGEIIGGVVSGILAIIALILLILFLKQRQKSQQVPQIDQEDPKPIVKEKEAEKIPLEDSQEEQKMALLPTPGIEPSVNNLEDSDEDEDDGKPRFASPIWLQEIHSNKIFNRQKSLLSEDKLKQLAEEEPLPPPPPLPEEEPEQVNGTTDQDLDDHTNNASDTDIV